MKSNKDPLNGFQNGMPRALHAVCRQPAFILILVLFVSLKASDAQVLYGTTSGGDYGAGTVFKVNADGTNYRSLPFTGSVGNNNPYYGYSGNSVYTIVKHSNGKIYGLTSGGGYSNEGILFEYDPVTGASETKYEFYFYDEGVPVGDLMEYQGKLYGNLLGMTYSIFSFDPSTNRFQREFTLPSFCNGLTVVDNKFYGMTYSGGVKRAGAIFEYNPQTKGYKVLFQFDHYGTGRYPDGGLTYHYGKVYGLTKSGGLYGQGTLFEFDLRQGVFKKRIDFKDNINGSYPSGDLQYHNGKLFGNTTSGGSDNHGLLFEYNIQKKTVHTLLNFTPETPGGNFTLVDGILYGTANTGNEPAAGYLISFDPLTRQYRQVFEFNGKETGGHPFGSLLADGHKLMGMTSTGGLGNGGVIFEYDIDQNHYEVEYSFNYFPYGKKPVSLLDVGDKLYGLTSEGGLYGYGVLFEVDTASFSFSALYHFTCDECQGYYSTQLDGKLIVNDNKLYGITRMGGREDGGVLFEYDLENKSYRSLHRFNNAETGMMPIGSITVLNSKIYGATSYGGGMYNGVVYEYDLVNSSYQVKQDNVYSTGIRFQLVALNNLLYGIGTGGSFGFGIITNFSLDQNTPNEPYELNNADAGAYPWGGLVARSSKIYGVTAAGGANYSGVIFEFDTQLQSYRKVFDFTDYGTPVGLAPSTDNRLYGARNDGTIFWFDLASQNYQPVFTINFGNNYSDNITALAVFEEDFCSPEAILTQVVDFHQGKRKDGNTIAMDKSDPQNALAFADANDSPAGGIKFVSLGIGGSITLAFDQPLCDKPGTDLYVVETSYGNPSFSDYPEQAEVLVSQYGDEWISLGHTHNMNVSDNCTAKLDSDFDIQPSGLDWIKYVRVVDTTNPFARRRDRSSCLELNAFAFNAAADGFDLDAIESSKLEKSGIPSARNTAGNATTVTLDASHASALLYPNPVVNYITINLSEEAEMAIMEDALTLEILDMQGKSWGQSTEFLDESWSITKDVSSLNRGLYIMRISTGNVLRNYKFVKK